MPFDIETFEFDRQTWPRVRRPTDECVTRVRRWILNVVGPRIYVRVVEGWDGNRLTYTVYDQAGVRIGHLYVDVDGDPEANADEFYLRLCAVPLQ